MNLKCLILVTISNLLCFGNGANILGIFHIPSQSHHILGSALLKELARKGHHVTMISPYPLKESVPNYADVSVEKLKFTKGDEMKKIIDPEVTVLEKLRLAFTYLGSYADLALSEESVKDFLASNATFDAVIQFWGFSEAMTAIGHRFNAPIIGFSPIGITTFMSSVSGIPTPYSYVPNMFIGYTDKMSFWERFVNTFVSIFADISLKYINMPIQRETIRKHFPDSPPLEKLLENVDIILANSHFTTESPRPLLPNTIPIGGFHLQEKQTLPEDLKSFLDNSKEGVVYFSFGSNIKAAGLSKQFKDDLIKAFGKLKQNVLWKFEDDIAAQLPSNVKIQKWLPQRAVLAHPNVKLFYTHGGLGGITEALYNGVPMIGTPFFGDQRANIANIVNRGCGLRLSFDEINEETLSATFKEVLNNPKYTKSVKRFSSLYRDQPINPMDKAVYWVEHVIKHKGAKHLKSQAPNLPFYQYMLLDVFAVFFLIISSVVFLIYLLLKKLITKLFKKSNKKIKTK